MDVPLTRRALSSLLLGLSSVATAPAETAHPTSPGTGPTPATSGKPPIQRGRALRFPQDHGAHVDARIEWWYATGWLQAAQDSGLVGFQITFFRTRTGLAAGLPGRLAPRQLLFAHAALTDLQARTHETADRLARWSGADLPELRSRASGHDADVALGGWSLRRAGAVSASVYEVQAQDDRFAFGLALSATQPLLLQGEAGFSRKGPAQRHASHYVTEPQLHARGSLTLGRRQLSVTGRAWLDHEWSDELLHPEAVGWDWIGMNGDDGSALTAFQLRRADGTPLWAGGSLRRAHQDPQPFAPTAVRFVPGRRWRSPGSLADYPVEWTIETPVGTHRVRALLDAQELDARASTGTRYWEGLSEWLDGAGRRIGMGYLEMTGYAGRLRL